jgi:hypothetical protein
MAATLIVLAKLFATALMAATCSNNFFAAKNTFCSNFAFLAATFVAAKNDISCSARRNTKKKNTPVTNLKTGIQNLHLSIHVAMHHINI